MIIEIRNKWCTEEEAEDIRLKLKGLFQTNFMMKKDGNKIRYYDEEEEMDNDG